MILHFWLFIFAYKSISILYCKEYSLSFLYSLRIGEKDTDIDMFIDNTISYSILYSNTDREYAHDILKEMDMDLFNDTIEINGLLLKEYAFKIKTADETVSNNQIQGILGLGIDEYDKGNTLLDALLKANLIKNREIYLTSSPTLLVQFRVDIPKAETNEYTTCKLTDKDDLNKKYRNGWLCEFTHLLSGQYSNWNQTFEIHGRAIFDTTSLYINAPNEYYEYFAQFYSLNETCNITKVNENDTNYNQYLKCYFEEEKYELLLGLYFIFDGIAYYIPGKDLFKESAGDNKAYDCLIKFSKEEKNIWTIGYPFLSHYKLMLNFDQEIIGFKGGETILNFTDEWQLWKEENKTFLSKVTDEKFIMLFFSIVGSIILLILLIFIIRGTIQSFKPPIHSKFIEEQNQ